MTPRAFTFPGAGAGPDVLRDDAVALGPPEVDEFALGEGEPVPDGSAEADCEPPDEEGPSEVEDGLGEEQEARSTRRRRIAALLRFI